MVLFEFISKYALIARKKNLNAERLFDIRASQEIATEENELEELRLKNRDKAKLLHENEELLMSIAIKDNTIGELSMENAELKSKLSQFAKYNQEINYENISIEEVDRFIAEFEKFKETDLFPFFKEIGTSIISSGTFPSKIDTIVQEKYKLNGLLKDRFVKDSNLTLIEFTKKGMFFWKEFVLTTKI